MGKMLGCVCDGVPIIIAKSKDVAAEKKAKESEECTPFLRLLHCILHHEPLFIKISKKN